MQATYTLTEDDLPAHCPPSSESQWNTHPKIYLPLHEKSPEARCPYCGNLFVLKGKNH